jgi:hypothetical protein
MKRRGNAIWLIGALLACGGLLPGCQSQSEETPGPTKRDEATGATGAAPGTPGQTSTIPPAEPEGGTGTR